MGSQRGDDLSRLLALWRARHGKHATGGWWSLAGFSYQAALFLGSFFRRVEEEGTEPGRLAEMESISDIVCPSDGMLRLIQVKRTLDARAMRSFLEEAYLLTALCRNELPELLSHLSFQVGCRTRATPLRPADVTMAEVIADGDAECWREMLGRIDPAAPIVEERDPLDELNVIFWNGGIRDSAALLERLLGKLLSAFLVDKPEEMRSLGRDLWSLYATAERRDEWRRIGRVLTPSEVCVDPVAATRTVLAGETPKLEHLRKGLFRNRPATLVAARARFEALLAEVESRELTNNVPVFWIAGRSGEGKSVLLLQLMADLAVGKTSPVLLQVTRQEVQQLLLLCSRWPPPIGSAGPLLVVVDDIYDQLDRESWEQTARDACTLSTPPICLVTCGPTEQMEQFSSRLAEVFDVTSFELPRLSAAEFDEFVEWYERRSGRSRAPSSLTRENPLLVQLMFELAHGERMPEFARRFERRLIQFGVFDVARTTVAATALYLDAPLSLVAEDRVRDALERLCSEDQLHFRIDESPGGGVRLAHPHLAWLIFQEWVGPPETLEKALARELHKIVEACVAEGTTAAPFSSIHVLVETTHLGAAGESESIRVADRIEVIRELYRLHTAKHEGVDYRALSRWLELEAKVVGLMLKPSALVCAAHALSSEDSHLLHGSVAGWVWLLAESSLDERDRYQEVARRFFLKYPDSPGVGYTLARILVQSRERQQVSALVRDWLTANASHPQAYHVLAPLVAANPADENVWSRAMGWLDANRSHPQAYWLLKGPVAANPSDENVRLRALVWLDTNRSHAQTHQVVVSLVAANPSDESVRSWAIASLDANRSHPQAFWLLAGLVAANPSDDNARSRAMGWLDANRSHPQAYWLLKGLVAANPSDDNVRSRAMEWLATNCSHAEAYQVAASLVAANPADESVRSRAMEWLDANPSHAQAYQMVAPLVAANPSDENVRSRAMAWLDTNRSHPQAYQVVASLVAANPSDDNARSRAMEWLDTHCSHSEASHVLAALITANPSVACDCERWSG